VFTQPEMLLFAEPLWSQRVAFQLLDANGLMLQLLIHKTQLLIQLIQLLIQMLQLPQLDTA
jgi:hypothetical protein